MDDRQLDRERTLIANAASAEFAGEGWWLDRANEEWLIRISGRGGQELTYSVAEESGKITFAKVWANGFPTPISEGEPS